MLLTGSFLRAIDDKLRIAIPRPLRLALGGADGTVLYVAPGTDQALAIYTEESFSRLAARLSTASPTASEVRAFSRLFFARAAAAEVDAQGRIRIPPELAQWAGLGKEAMLVGVQDHLELWDRGRWETYLNSKQPDYDQLAEAAFDKLP